MNPQETDPSPPSPNAAPADPRRLLEIPAGINLSGAPFSLPSGHKDQYTYTVAASRFSVAPTRPYLTSCCYNPPPDVPRVLWQQLLVDLDFSNQRKRQVLDQVFALCAVPIYCLLFLGVKEGLMRAFDVYCNDYYIFGFISMFYFPLVVCLYEGLIGSWLSENTRSKITFHDHYFRQAGCTLEVQWADRQLFEFGILTIRPSAKHYQGPPTIRTGSGLLVV